MQKPIRTQTNENSLSFQFQVRIAAEHFDIAAEYALRFVKLSNDGLQRCVWVCVAI